MSEILEPPPPEPRKRSVLTGLRNSLLTGLVVILPVWLTGWFFWTLIGWIDSWVLPFVPTWFQPEEWIGINLHGVGLIFLFIFTILVGWIAKGLIGRSLIRTAEGIVERMPVVRSVYSGVKQIAETVFAQSERSFEKACLIEYPRRGMFALGFISTEAKGEVNRRAPTDEQLVSVFLPTTPNPTSGYLLFVPKSDVTVLDMTVEDAAKLVISAGLVYPDQRRKNPSKPLELAPERPPLAS